MILHESFFQPNDLRKTASTALNFVLLPPALESHCHLLLPRHFKTMLLSSGGSMLFKLWGLPDEIFVNSFSNISCLQVNANASSRLCNTQNQMRMTRFACLVGLLYMQRRAKVHYIF